MSSLSLDLPAPTATAAYERTLQTLRERAEALSDILDSAELRRGPVGRQAALSELHTRLRGMAAVANHALGGWPDPGQEPQ